MSKFSSSDISYSGYSPRMHGNERLNISKAILQECSSYSGDSLYNHLSNIIKRVLDENPPNVVDYFEEYSRSVRQDRFYSPEDPLIDMYIEPKFLQPAKRFIDSISGHELRNFGPNEIFGLSKKNILQLLNLWSSCGTRFSSSESFLLAVAVQKLGTNTNNTRFWGKILGLQKDYYIIETDSEQNSLSVQVNVLEKKYAIFQKTYYVCNDLLGEWNKLPNVTLEQMNFSQELRKYFIGDLETDIPLFPGNGKEKHYLRARIEQITAATYIAPEEYFIIRSLNENEKQNSEIEKDSVGIIMENPKFEPSFLIYNMDIENWVRSRPNFEDSKTNNHGLFLRCSEDILPSVILPLSIRLSTNYIQLNPMVIVRSNLWPGANSITVGYTVDNMYIGFGQKYTRTYHPFSKPDTNKKVHQEDFEKIKDLILPISITKAIRAEKDDNISTSATESDENITIHIAKLMSADDNISTSATESDENIATYRRIHISANEKVYDSTSVEDISDNSRTNLVMTKIEIEDSSTSGNRSITNEFSNHPSYINVKVNDSRSTSTNPSGENSKMDLNILRISAKKPSSTYSTSQETAPLSKSMETRNLRQTQSSTSGFRGSNIEFISNLPHIDEDSNDNKSTSAIESDDDFEQNERLFISAGESKKVTAKPIEHEISKISQRNSEINSENDKSSTSVARSTSNE